jgi:hypothetical protein
MDASIDRGFVVFGHADRIAVMRLMESERWWFARCGHVTASRVTVMRQFAKARDRRM